MNDKIRRLEILTILLITSLFLLFFYTIYFNDILMYYDYALYIILGVLLLLATRLGLAKALILSVVILFIYSSVVFYQMITGYEEIWRLNYAWFIAYPLTSFFVGSMTDIYAIILEKSHTCENMKEKMISTDEITGFGNGREFLRQLDIEMAKARRYGHSLTLALLEIQYFDQLILIYGKEDTKKLFQTIGESISRVSRIEDTKFRVEDSMLALILPHTELDNAKIIKKRIKEELLNMQIDDNSSLKRYKIELKIGLLSYHAEIPNPLEFKVLAAKEIEYDV